MINVSGAGVHLAWQVALLRGIALAYRGTFFRRNSK
jgi:hypothetical protein